MSLHRKDRIKIGENTVKNVSAVHSFVASEKNEH